MFPSEAGPTPTFRSVLYFDQEDGPPVVGRPVHFVNASNPDDERLALTRLEAALHNAGFRDVSFEYEPVGAAYHYERDLDHDELIVIADIGGGTSDFSMIRVGPTVASAGRRHESILGHDGVAVAGDAFDGKLVRCLDRLLDDSGRAAGEVDRVFLTGGSSFVPAVRRIFEERFGAERIRTGAELTSVANGLALRAQELARD